MLREVHVSICRRGEAALRVTHGCVRLAGAVFSIYLAIPKDLQEGEV